MFRTPFEGAWCVVVCEPTALADNPAGVLRPPGFVGLRTMVELTASVHDQRTHSEINPPPRRARALTRAARFIYVRTPHPNDRCCAAPLVVFLCRREGADAGVREAWEHTARTAASLGAAVVEVSMPSVPQVRLVWCLLLVVAALAMIVCRYCINLFVSRKAREQTPF